MEKGRKTLTHTHIINMMDNFYVVRAPNKSSAVRGSIDIEPTEHANATAILRHLSNYIYWAVMIIRAISSKYVKLSSYQVSPCVFVLGCVWPGVEDILRSAFTLFIHCALTHWGRDELNNISQTTFSNVFSSMKMIEFRLKFHWSLFPMVQLTIFQHWFR